MAELVFGQGPLVLGASSDKGATHQHQGSQSFHRVPVQQFNPQNNMMMNHQQSQKQKPGNSRFKTELCRSWSNTGSCRYGDKCQFAHGKEELRPLQRHPKYKTELCRTFHTQGICPYGPRCHFLHNLEEEDLPNHRKEELEKMVAKLRQGSAGNTEVNEEYELDGNVDDILASLSLNDTADHDDSGVSHDGNSPSEVFSQEKLDAVDSGKRSYASSAFSSRSSSHYDLHPDTQEFVPAGPISRNFQSYLSPHPAVNINTQPSPTYSQSAGTWGSPMGDVAVGQGSWSQPSVLLRSSSTPMMGFAPPSPPVQSLSSQSAGISPSSPIPIKSHGAHHHHQHPDEDASGDEASRLPFFSQLTS